MLLATSDKLEIVVSRTKNSALSSSPYNIPGMLVVIRNLGRCLFIVRTNERAPKIPPKTPMTEASIVHHSMPKTILKDRKQVKILIDNSPAYGYNTTMYSVEEAAVKLGMDPSQVRRLLKTGEIKGKKLARDGVVLSLD